MEWRIGTSIVMILLESGAAKYASRKLLHIIKIAAIKGLESQECHKQTNDQKNSIKCPIFVELLVCMRDKRYGLVIRIIMTNKNAQWWLCFCCCSEEYSWQ